MKQRNFMETPTLDAFYHTQSLTTGRQWMVSLNREYLNPLEPSSRPYKQELDPDSLRYLEKQKAAKLEREHAAKALATRKAGSQTPAANWKRTVKLSVPSA